MSRIGLIVFLTSFFSGVITATFVHVGVWIGAFVLLLGVTLLLVAIRSASSLTRMLAVGVIGLGFAGVRVAVVPESLLPIFVSQLETSVEVEGVVVTLPDIRETSTRLTVEVYEGSAATRIIAAAHGSPAVHVGDRVRVTGKLTRPEPFAGDGGRVFRYDEYLRKEGVYALIQPARIEVIGRDDTSWLRFMRVLESARTGFMRAVGRAIPEPESALAVGLIAGGKQGLGEELIEAFTVAGLLQIVVLSGYNVMVIANSIQRMLGFLPKRLGAVLACMSIACFVLAAGGGSPALRAGLMALLCIMARALGTPYDVLRTLFITLFLLVLWNPLLLSFDPGLQFSFLATLGLIMGTPIIASKMTFIRHEGFRELLASSLAAQIGVMPILLWQTGNLSLVAIAANIIVTPVIPFAMATSAIAAGASVVFVHNVPLVPLIAGVPAYTLLTFIIQVARVSAAIPYAQVTIPAFGFWVVPVSYVVLGSIVWRGYSKCPPRKSGGHFESLY